MKFPDEIRFIGDLQRLELKPGDTLVLKANQVLSQEVIHRLKEQMTDRFPDVPFIILDAGLELGVLGKSA